MGTPWAIALRWYLVGVRPGISATSTVGWREASSLGVLMNTRGLMELVVLNVGLDLGVISPRLFAMLVIMAVVTTLLTSPLLHLLERGAGAPVGAIHE